MRWLALVVMIAQLCFPTAVSACICAAPTSVAEVAPDAIVFKGRVVSVQQRPGQGRIWEEGGDLWIDVPNLIVEFDVIKQIRGENRDRITVHMNKQGTTSCDLKETNFSPGDVFLLSVKPLTPDRDFYYNNFCDLRLRVRPE